MYEDLINSGAPTFSTTGVSELSPNEEENRNTPPLPKRSAKVSNASLNSSET